MCCIICTHLRVGVGYQIGRRREAPGPVIGRWRPSTGRKTGDQPGRFGVLGAGTVGTYAVIGRPHLTTNSCPSQSIALTGARRRRFPLRARQPDVGVTTWVGLPRWRCPRRWLPAARDWAPWRLSCEERMADGQRLSSARALAVGMTESTRRRLSQADILRAFLPIGHLRATTGKRSPLAASPRHSITSRHAYASRRSIPSIHWASLR